MDSKTVIALAAVLAVMAGLAAAVVLTMDQETGPEETWTSVIYDGNGGDCEVSDDRHYKPGDGAEVRFSPTPVRTGYIFMGWSEEKENGNLDYDINRGTTHAVLGGEDLVLYAVYKPDPGRLDVGTYMKLDAKLSVPGYPSISCIGYTEISIVSVSGNSNTLKTVMKMDILDGVKTIKTVNTEDISSSDVEPDGSIITSMDYGNYLYKGESVPVYIVKEVSPDSPGLVTTTYTGLYENIVYCMVMDYGSGSDSIGMKFTFELSEYEMRYSDPDEGGSYHVFYDGNGGLNTLGDGNAYDTGDEVSLAFSPAPFKEGKVFCGWSEDRDGRLPEYNPLEGTSSLEIGTRDVTLYAVYSDSFFLADEGTEYRYKVTEIYEGKIQFTYEMDLTLKLTKVGPDGMVFKVTGTGTTKDGSTTETEELEFVFDTSKDLWGYNEGYMELTDERLSELTFEGKAIPVQVYDYDGTEYVESQIDQYGLYDGIMYRSDFSCEYVDGDTMHTVIELMDSNIVTA